MGHSEPPTLPYLINLFLTNYDSFKTLCSPFVPKNSNSDVSYIHMQHEINRFYTVNDEKRATIKHGRKLDNL